MEKDKLHNNPEFLTDTDKEILRKRILDSVRLLKAKRQRRNRYAVGMAVAASLTIIISIVNFKESTPVSISDFAKSSAAKEGKGTDKVVLVLEGGEQVSLDEETATLKYSSTGEYVAIGAHKAIDQETSKNKEVVYNTLIVPYGKRSEVKLSDGTKVWLNSGSRLIYPAVFTPQKREVYLEGEAIFQVTHNKERPFLVLSEGQRIEVLGTVFNVSSYLDEGAINTVLKSGSIQIHYEGNAKLNSKDQLKILPGTMATYNKDTGKMMSQEVDVDQYFSWKDGVLIFKNDDLRYILKRLSRYYNVEIGMAKGVTGEATFSGYLDLKSDIEKVIGVLKEATDLEYERITDHKIIITN